MKTLEEKIETVLDSLRPYLQREGGNIEIDHYDKETGILYVRMIGACNGCYLASSDISESIEVVLMDEIPEITGVKLANQKENTGFRSLMQQMMAPLKKKRKEEFDQNQKKSQN